MPETGSELAPLTARADVELRLPSDGAYVSVLRTTAVGLAARLDFTLDDIEDLRMAVGEAAAIALEVAEDDADLRASFWLGEGRMDVLVSTAAVGTPAVDRDSFGWQVLTTLASEVDATAAPGSLQIRLTVTATPLGDAV